MASGNSPMAQVMQACAGGFSAGFTRFVTQPFDVLKIRFQMQVEPVGKSTKSKYKGVGQALSVIYREEGIKGFWKGHNAGQAMYITYGLVQFWSYEQMRLLIANMWLFEDRPHLTYFAAGGFAGCLGVIASQPFDLVRTRVIASDPNSKTGRISMLRALHLIVRKEGFPALFRGMFFTILQIYPLVGSNFLIYKTLNEICVIVKHHITQKENPDRVIPSVMLFINGGLAGVVSKALVYPADFFKKRIQLAAFSSERTSFGENPRCPTLKQCIANTMRQEGIFGFYKGMLPTLIKSGLSSAVYFTLYDHLNYRFIIPYQERNK